MKHTWVPALGIITALWLVGGAAFTAPEAEDEAGLLPQIQAARDDLRRQAEALLKDAQAGPVVERLKSEAAADENVALQRLNLAAVVAALAGDGEAAKGVLAEQVLAQNSEVMLALGRHALILELGKPELADASQRNMGLQIRGQSDPESTRERVGLILAAEKLLLPDTMAYANITQNGGNLYDDMGDLDAAWECYETALALQTRLEPNGLNMAITLLCMGNVACNRGDLEQGRSLLERSLAIVREKAPGSYYEAGLLTNLGNIHSALGDLDAALDSHQRGLAIIEKVQPGTMVEAQIRLNIGNIQSDRGDLEGALRSYLRSQEILERERPDTLELSEVLENLGVLYEQLGDREKALALRQRCVEIVERLAPDSMRMAEMLQNRACLLEGVGDGARALEDCKRGLALMEKWAPGSVRHAQALQNAAWAYEDCEDIATARACYEKSAEIRGRVAPRTADAARGYSALGTFYETQGMLKEAREQMEKAVSAIEEARTTSGASSEARSGFLGEWIGTYRSLIRLMVALGDTTGAADLTERMRARTLLDDLAERSFAGDLPPDLKQRREGLDALRRDLYAQLRGLQGPPPPPEEAEKLTAALERASLDQEALTREIRAADPRYASLQYPQPATVADLSKQLDPGTVVLSFIAGNQQTWLFVFGPEVPVRVIEIPLAGDALWDEVEKCLAAVQEAKDQATQEAEPRQSLAALGKLLLSEAAPVLAGARRLMILPDGPLWLVPFQALVLADGSYLADRWPIHYAPSATTVLEGRRLRAAQVVKPKTPLLALGDPDFSLPAGSERGQYIPVRGGAFSAERKAQAGVAFERLAYSGAEVAAVGDLFGDGAKVRQGTRATEACVRQEGPGSRVIHLATHGLLDPAMPMESAVVLTIPREPKPDNDGFLKAWKVLNLDLRGCDLVTLSACETAKGRIRSGEGIIGLTRAFLYAGAGSVVCTQWSVADDSTAALMVRFYEHYRAGSSKDEALREAMREVRSGKLVDGSALPLPEDIGPWQPQWAQPCRWAPFIVVGDFATDAP